MMTDPALVAKRAAREKEALSKFELITPKEVNARRITSASILGVTGLLYATQGAALMSPAFWSMLTTTSLSVLGTAETNV